jgi:formate dehydrogenase subunit gamma
MTIRSALAAAAVAWSVALLPAGVLAQGQPTQPAPAAPAASVDSQAKRQVEQPGNNAPVWREIRSGETNYTSIKGPETGVLIQPQAKFFGQDTMTTAGEAWRKYRNGPVTFYGGWFVVAIALIIGAFYLWKGPIRLHEPPSGRMILRFNAIERWTHWAVAFSFSVLGISGLVILFGKHILLPVIGYTLFAWLTMLMKNLHNFIGPLFTLSIVLMFIVYVRHNFPIGADFKWLAKAGGMVSGQHVPSGRFNAGEKGWFWIGVVVLGTIMSISGFIMLFPNFEQLRTTMQASNIVHGVGGVIFIAISFGHIYLGTLGMQGAYDGMRNGYVDEAWAKEHHELWYNDVKSGKVRGVEQAPPAAQPHHRGA